MKRLIALPHKLKLMMTTSITEKMTLRPADQLGPVLTSRNRAAVMRAEIEAVLRAGEHVVVDLDGVQTMSPSFADELVAKLGAQTRAGDVEFLNIPSTVQPLLRFVLNGRMPA